MLGEIYILSGVMSLIYKTLDFAAYFTKADALLPNGSKVIDRNLALVGGASFITNRDLGTGSVRKMTETMFKAMPHAVRVMRGCGAGLEYLVAAEADYMTGDMKNAEKNAYAALYKAQPEEQYDIEYMAHSILLRVATYQGDYRRASVERDAVGKYFKRSQTPDCGLLCDITVSGFYVPFGRCDRVSQWVLEDSEKTKSLAPISINRGQWVRARCMLHNGRYGELLGYLGQLDELYKAKNSLLGLIENSVMRSIACYYSGDHDAAFKSLYESYLMSYENDIIMLHIEFGKWMRTLVRAAKAAENCPIPKEWLDLIYRKSSTYAKRLSVMGDAYEEAESGDKKRQVNLSKRERDVLTGLCQGLTREEIALTYNLSINTVKSMMPILYDKLGAANKMDAVRIASSFNLMSDFA
jgi:ATP/maltotriose-dependent transcriptional regulator MalT